MKTKVISEIEALSQTIITYTKIVGYQNDDYEYFRSLKELKCYAYPKLLMYGSYCPLCQYYYIIEHGTCSTCPLESCYVGPYHEACEYFRKGDWDKMRIACLAIVNKCLQRLKELEEENA